jgi:hypothetical protein
MRIGKTRCRAAAVAAALTLAVTAASAQTSATSDTSGTAVVAARSPTAVQVERRYTLVDVGGRALPAEIEKEWRCREEVTAGTLVLRGDGRWRLETSLRETCGGRAEMDHEDEDGTYRAQGDTIQFFDEDGNRNDAEWSILPEIDLDELDRGSIADGSTLSVRLTDEKTLLRFRRQDL